MNINIGDRIQLGDGLQMNHSFMPGKYEYKFATITKVNGSHIVCRIDNDVPGYEWCVRFDDFTLISSVPMPNREDLFEFLGC